MSRLEGLRLDHKGAGYVILGIAWIFIGGAVLDEITPTRPGVWHQLLPVDVRAGLWFATGAAGIIGGLAIPRAGRSGWLRIAAAGLLASMPLVRTASYLTGYIISLLPGGSPGYPTGWYSAVIHLVMVAFVAYVASERQGSTVMRDVAHVLRETRAGVER